MYLSELISILVQISNREDEDIPVKFFTDGKGGTYNADITTRCGITGNKLEVVEIQIEPLYKG